MFIQTVSSKISLLISPIDLKSDVNVQVSAKTVSCIDVEEAFRVSVKLM